MSVPDQLEHEALFLPADPPRDGMVAVAGGSDRLTVVVAPGDRAVEVEVTRLPVADALASVDGFWGAAVQLALRLVARGRILPGVSPGGFDAWRIGPLDEAEAAAVRDLAAAMPPAARSVPLPGAALRLAAAEPLLRAFLDAVADTLTRDVDATLPFAAPAPQPVEHLREWAAEAAAGVDAGLRVALRVEAPDDPATGRFRAVVVVQALADPTRVADLGDVWSGDATGFGSNARLDGLTAVRRAARFWDPLARLLSSAVPDVVELADPDLADLLGDGGDALSAAGITVHWPRELHPVVGTRAVARGPAPTSFAPGAPGGGLELDWEVALDGEPLTAAERQELAASRRPIVRLRDRWVLVDATTRRRARAGTAGPVTAVAALGAALTGEIETKDGRARVAQGGWLTTLRERLTAAPEPVTAPDGLHATLRDYQLRGVGWLQRMTGLGLGACLADDMGLGKTITLIALHLTRTGPTLVVCPASLMGNWEREFGRFAPDVAVTRFHGEGRALDPAADVVLTTYGTLRRDAAALAAHPWDLLVADEAQHVKNPASATAAALRAVPAAARVALTGTPVENDLTELWAILDWATPGLLGAQAEFRHRWADPIADGDFEAAATFARLVAPFLLRRRKTDPGIAPELPRKTETDHPVRLTREQAALYTAAVDEALAAIADADGMARRGRMLALFTALKQICNHPAQYVREEAPVLAGRSGKLDLLDELLDEITAGGGSALVFTQYVTMARLLERHLADRGIGASFLHGGTPVAERDRLVDAFQRGEAPVFLLSLKAAGTGLNLTRADHVVHFDRWWNPAVEEQATDRAYRIGQTRPVQVHRLIAEGTIEDRIAAMLASKRELADAVLTGGEAGLTELTDAELAELVTLREGS